MTELILIFLVVLLVFGAKRIPEIAKGLGKGIREFKDATTDIKRELTVEENNRSIQPPRQGTTASYSGSSSYHQASPAPAAPAPAATPAPAAPASQPAPTEDAAAERRD